MQTLHNYREFWLSNGLNYIAPKENPEGFDFIEIIKDLSKGSVLDFGCGKGKNVPAFKPENYLGVDFNPKVIEIVKEKFPEYEFRVTDLEEEFEANTALFYSVCVHIPDDLIKEQIERVKCDRLIIAEIMDPSYKRNVPGYTLSNHRTVEEYDEIIGRKRTETITRVYEYYGCDITYALFT